MVAADRPSGSGASPGAALSSAREREDTQDRVDEPVALKLRDVESGDHEYGEFYKSEVERQGKKHRRDERESPSLCGRDYAGHNVKSPDLDPPCLRPCLRLPSVDGLAGGGSADFHIELRLQFPACGLSISVVTTRESAAIPPWPSRCRRGTAGLSAHTSRSSRSSPDALPPSPRRGPPPTRSLCPISGARGLHATSP